MQSVCLSVTWRAEDRKQQPIDGKVCICFLAVAFGPSDSVSVDCKTVRIFAYSSTYARAVKQKVWNEAKNESETGERPYGRVKFVRFARVRLLRHALPISVLIFSGACSTSSVKYFWNSGVFSLFQTSRDHVTSLEQTVVPHHDYFSAQFLLQFSAQSIYHVTVSSSVIDSSGILWNTGPQNTLQVKTTDSASRKQRTSRS